MRTTLYIGVFLLSFLCINASWGATEEEVAAEKRANCKEAQREYKAAVKKYQGVIVRGDAASASNLKYTDVSEEATSGGYLRGARANKIIATSYSAESTNLAASRGELKSAYEKMSSNCEFDDAEKFKRKNSNSATSA